MTTKSQPPYDLLGDPIPPNWGGRGRPEHIPTQENRQKVRLLLAFGWADRQIAAALRITRPTLRKHYFSDLRHRDEAHAALEANRLTMVYDAARTGNVGAMRELGRIIERHELTLMPTRHTANGDDETSPEKLGKKELADRAAKDGHVGTGWNELLN